MKKIITLILTLIIISSCNSNYKKVNKITHYYNGIIEDEIEYKINESKDTVYNGFCKFYDEDGKLTKEQNFKNDLLNGESKFYWKNSKIRSIVTYNNDKVVIQKYNWDENGNLLDSNTIINGNGVFKSYFRNGKILQTCEYKEGLANGTEITYDKNGKIISIFKKINGEKDGLCTTFPPNGKEEINFKNDIPNGNFIFTDSIQKIIYKGKFMNGIEVDTTLTFNFDNKLLKTSVYKSNNFTYQDSLDLGLIENNSKLHNLVFKNIHQFGILIKSY